MPTTPELGASPGGRLSALERLRRAPAVDRFLRRPLMARLLSPARGTGSVHKFIRYSMVSAVAIVISQVVILVCAWVFGFSGVVANAVGAAASTPASYELNRKWAWGKHGKSHMWREVVPFWALTVAGFLASTVTVGLADSFAKHHSVTGLARALVIMGASLFAYGVIWIAKFVIFNRLVFVNRAGSDEQDLEGAGALGDLARTGTEEHAPASAFAPPPRSPLTAGAVDGRPSGI